MDSVMAKAIAADRTARCSIATFLERDDFVISLLSYAQSMIFSENRYPLFGIMLRISASATRSRRLGQRFSEHSTYRPAAEYPSGAVRLRYGGRPRRGLASLPKRS